MNFAESVKYLYSLGNEVLAMKLGLENIKALLQALGSPHEKFFKVQVAGTNGKGSTCAFLEAICLQAGIKTGLNTSPHLVSITERIRINGEEISEEEFARHATQVRAISEELVSSGKLESLPTFFEQVTAIAIKAFAEAGVELAILETGLGGRFDAVTAAMADIVAFTPIDLDHQRILGDTIEKIAEEKAAIIRKGVTVISASQPSEALKVIVRRSEECGTKLRLASEIEVREEGDRLFFKTSRAEYCGIQLGLLGRHQIENAKTAVLIAEELQSRWQISTAHIVRGLKEVKHKGRLESDGRFLFDGSHNAAGAQALRRFLDEFVKKPIVMIFSVMRDKDVEQMGEALFPKANFLILTEVSQRSMSVEQIAGTATKFLDADRIVLTKSVDEALQKALDLAEEDSLILVTGSLYLIGEVQKRRKALCRTISF